MQPTNLQNKPGRGLGLALIGGLALSFDIPLIRLAQSDPYTVMVFRGAGLALVLWLYWWLIANRSDMPLELLTDRDFLMVGSISGLNNIFFTLAVFNTSTANVVFILAFNAMLAALISWPFTGERPRLHTILAIFATLLGVGIIVSEGLGTGNLLGDIFALICAVLLALSLTLTRKAGKDLSLAPGFGGVVSAAFALPTALWIGTLPQAPEWLLFNSLVVVPLAGITLWLAPRFIAAPQGCHVYLLETALTPLWVWYLFKETPSPRVFIGGTIVVGALLMHGIWELCSSGKND